MSRGNLNCLIKRFYSIDNNNGIHHVNEHEQKNWNFKKPDAVSIENDIGNVRNLHDVFLSVQHEDR